MRTRPLTLQVDDGRDELAETFAVRDGAFVRGNLVVSGTGVRRHDRGIEYNGIREADIESLRVVGKGISSQVMLVRHTSGVLMALKKINIYDKAKRMAIMEEIGALYEAQCPALIGFYGAYFAEGAINIALEYMDQGCLASVLSARGAMPESAAAGAAFQALWGLAYLKHEKRVHRDVKPQNILCNARGEVKLTDFGISKELENSIAMAQTFVGTCKYMSPERIHSQPYSYTGDVWSLGLVVLELITGAYPYEGCSTQLEIMQTILETPSPLPPQPSCAELQEFLTIALHKDPASRLPPDVLIHAPWLRMHGAVDIDSARARLQQWFLACGVAPTDEFGQPADRGSARSDRWTSPPPAPPALDDAMQQDCE